MPAITATSVIGSASIQCATSGNSRTTSDHVSTSRHRRTGVSRALAMSPTPHVPLSAGSVSVDTESYACSGGPKRGGMDPSADRKCRAKYTKPQSSRRSRTGRAPTASSHAGTADRRPPASTTRSARCSVPSSVTTPVTCGAALARLSAVRTPRTATPRCTVTPGVVAATRSTDGLDHRPPPGQRLVALVAVAPPAAHLLGHGFQRVEAQRAVGVERRRHRRQVTFDDVTEAGQEVVDHPELVDPATRTSRSMPRRPSGAAARDRVRAP